MLNILNIELLQDLLTSLYRYQELETTIKQLRKPKFLFQYYLQ